MDIPSLRDLKHPVEFEELCVDLLMSLGFDVDWRKGSNTNSSPADGGVDIIATYRREDPDGTTYDERWFVECKHSAVPAIGQAEVDKLLRATKVQDKKAHVLLFMTSGFLKNAAKDYITVVRRDEWPLRVLYWERKQLERLIGRLRSGTYRSASTSNQTTFFLQAMSLLSDDDVQVRAGALETLEHVGEASTAMRRTVISALCRYLRNDCRRRDVDDAHILAQDILARHITWPDRKHRKEPPATFWEGMEIDLQGALLKNFDLSHAHVTSASFKNAEFVGDTWLADSFIAENLSFEGAQLNGEFYFSGSEVHGSASFSGAYFHETSFFGRSTFKYDTHFIDCRFFGYASFVSCDFRGALSFHGSSFHGSAEFTSLKVAWDAIFAKAKFKDATFELAEFGDIVNFSGVYALEEDLNLHGVRVATKLLNNIWPKGWGELPEGNGMAVIVRIPEGREQEFRARQKELRMKYMFSKDAKG
ncbi:restriction endonuclease [Nonomuraea bangladeshensis]|uniref:Restriction endonuclease n=1 Tax=Nonomuraea bangladeshensis TaxID=404385 RepID=A0ABV3H8E7_9ACTN